MYKVYNCVGTHSAILAVMLSAAEGEGPELGLRLQQRFTSTHAPFPSDTTLRQWSSTRKLHRTFKCNANVRERLNANSGDLSVSSLVAQVRIAGDRVRKASAYGLREQVGVERTGGGRGTPLATRCRTATNLAGASAPLTYSRAPTSARTRTLAGRRRQPTPAAPVTQPSLSHHVASAHSVHWSYQTRMKFPFGSKWLVTR